MLDGIRQNLKNVSVNDILGTFVKPPYRLKLSSFSWQFLTTIQQSLEDTKKWKKPTFEAVLKLNFEKSLF